MSKSQFVGVDLFSGAGGLSLGAQMAGIDVQLAVENDPHAAATYAHNHPNTRLVVDDIRNVKSIDLFFEKKTKILFGGPPCQGFSTSNQKTRSKNNISNWLFQEFVRITDLWKPDWVVLENVKGIVETEQGLFLRNIVDEFTQLGYTCSYDILNALEYGVPQVRSRFFLIGSRHGKLVTMPKSIFSNPITVKDAISDLPPLINGANENILQYKCDAQSSYAKKLRNGQSLCSGNLVSKNNLKVIERYMHIPQGGNWENIPKELMNNYSDHSRCHTGIYKRLCSDKPSVVLGNYRKNMLVHPWENRGLSVREAARLQSFPDWYEFKGSIGFQQQQVGNAVPPLLSMAIFKSIVNI
jgi:DNA (cytosine-5)-methyltransferase 1